MIVGLQVFISTNYRNSEREIISFSKMVKGK